MWKVSFKDPMYKKVQKFNDRVTIVTLKGDMKIPIEVITSMSKEMCDWMMNKINPRVKVYRWQGIINITATGKAVRSAEDKNNPILAERIAECRAKIAIYKFVIHLLNRYINYYIKLIGGRLTLAIPEITQNNSLFDITKKYVILMGKESKHLKELLKEHD